MTNDQVNSPDETSGDVAEQVKETKEENRSTTRISGTTGTGIAAGETGYGESGQLPDTAAPPVVQE